MVQRANEVAVSPNFSIGGDAVIKKVAAVYDVEPMTGSPWFVPFVLIGASAETTLEGGAAGSEVVYDADTVVETGSVDEPLTSVGTTDQWYIIKADSVVTSAAPTSSLDVTAHRITIPTPQGGSVDDADGCNILWAAGTVPTPTP